MSEEIITPVSFNEKNYLLHHRPLTEEEVVNMTSHADVKSVQREAAEKKMFDADTPETMDKWATVAEAATKSIIQEQINLYNNAVAKLVRGGKTIPAIATLKIICAAKILETSMPSELDLKK